jgi:multimeric flavodoxin WrbA
MPKIVIAEGSLPDGAWEQIAAAADTVVFGSPSCMGRPSWQFKKFADASSKPWAHTCDDLNNLGGHSGITASPSDASPDEMLPGAISFAKAFGERIVEATAKFAG